MRPVGGSNDPGWGLIPPSRPLETASGKVRDAAGFGVLLVQGAGRQAAGITRTVGAPLVAAHQGDRAVEHEQPRVELVRVRFAMGVRLDTAFADLVALAPDLGFEGGSVHGGASCW